MRTLLVAATANIGTAIKEGSREESSAVPRANPVALEVPITVTGARTGEKTGARDLFSEETTTAVVFHDGAVIRLAAGVAPGQLLFVTNKKSNREMVCQVVCKPNEQAAHGFVEVDFTEAVEDFWGVVFPAEAPVRRQPKVAKVVKAAVAAEVRKEPEASATDEPSPEEVEKLKAELEQLREQVNALVKGQAGLAGAKAAAAAKASSVPQQKIPTAKVELAPVNEQSPAAPATALVGELAAKMGMMTETHEASRAVVGMSLPGGRSESPKPLEEPQSAAEESLPQPGLDFSHAPVSVGHAGAKRVNRLRIGLLSALMAAVVVGAWYENWIPMFPHENGVAVNGVRPPNRARAAAAKAVGALKAAGAAAMGAKGTAPEKSAADVDAAEKEIAAKRTAATDSRGAKANSRMEARGNNAKDSTDIAPAEAATAEAGSETVSNVVVPAKLIKAANPVYPPDAMRHYITGDVRAEAVVEANGKVGTVKVLSGPKPLREAAVEALKQYEYEAGTQGGKAVESKVVVTVKFWFNP